MRFGIREYILLAILIAIPVSSYWLVFRPHNRSIEEARREIQYKRERLDALRQVTARSADLRAENEELANRIRAIEARLPTNKEVDHVIRQVSDLALEAGLEAPLVNTEKSVKAALYMEQPLKMTITGDFHGFYDFLLRLEQLPRITRIPDMTIKRTDSIDGYMQAEFTLSIYFQEEAAGESGK
jgi:type IV pilus assembly protein PilO